MIETMKKTGTFNSKYNAYESDKFYGTEDMTLAITLETIGFTVVKLDSKPNSNEVFVFIFDRSKELEKAIEDFWTDKILVNPKEFFNRIRLMRTRLKDAKQLSSSY